MVCARSHLQAVFDRECRPLTCKGLKHTRVYLDEILKLEFYRDWVSLTCVSLWEADRRMKQAETCVTAHTFFMWNGVGAHCGALPDVFALTDVDPNPFAGLGGDGQRA